MKTFTKKIKNMVFEVVKNNDYNAYKKLCDDAENSSVLEKIRVCYGSLTGFQANASIYYDEYIKYLKANWKNNGFSKVFFPK